MFYRRKVLLSLLQTFNNEIDKIKLQKLLFLLCRVKSIEEKEAYTFVPYKYGCYSFQANADLLTLKKYGIVDEKDNKWVKKDKVNYLIELNNIDRQKIGLVKSQYGNKNTGDLIKHTYKAFPYYAINSIVLEKYISKHDIDKVNKCKSDDDEIMLFTIGYEGISIEEYLNKLINKNIKVLCDVRKNAKSMKYGFSKKQLQNACNGIGIEYIHFPDLGINSDKRQNLDIQADYDNLFSIYKRDNLRITVRSQKEILYLLQDKKRVALTCFESNIMQCHRVPLLHSILKLSTSKIKFSHI